MNKERYNRHIILSEIGEEGQQKLINARVLLVGVGGLGSPIALYLAAAGMGTIGLVDADTVSESNLQRQVLYTESEVGKPKVECARRRLLALNSSLTVETYPIRFTQENASSLISKYDLVIDGCDNYSTRYLINDECSRQHKPYVYGAIGEFKGQVSVFNYQGGPDYRMLYPDEAALTSQALQIRGVMGVVPAITGSVQVAEAIKIIVGCGDVLSNRLLTFDALSMEFTVIDL